MMWELSKNKRGDAPGLSRGLPAYHKHRFSLAQENAYFNPYGLLLSSHEGPSIPLRNAQEA